MNSQLIKAKIIEYKYEIEELRAEIEDLQNICQHTEYMKEHKGSTGNWYPGDDCYWTNFTCQICNKHWTVEGSV